MLMFSFHLNGQFHGWIAVLIEAEIGSFTATTLYDTKLNPFTAGVLTRSDNFERNSSTRVIFETYLKKER